MRCPLCNALLIIKVIKKRDIDLQCHNCDFVWGNCSRKIPDEMNEFYTCGNVEWTREELSLIGQAMKRSYLFDDDRRFFKGRKTYSVWRENDKIINVFDKCEELIKDI
jgi:hypothetical protein